MTGQTSGVSGTTGVAATDVLTFPAGVTIVNGYGFTFNSITGGANLSTGIKYYLIGVSGQTAQLALSVGGTAVDFTTNLTASSGILQTDELQVWSSEFRDIFSPSSTLSYSSSDSTTGAVTTATNIIFSGDVTVTAPVGGAPPTGLNVVPVADPYGSNSDDIFHYPLRQTFLSRTYWKFTMSTVPTTLYAEVMQGDIISDTAPNTP